MSITVTGVQKSLPDELPLRDLRRLRECFDDYAVDASEVAEAMAVEVPEPADGEDGDGVEPSSSSPPPSC